MLLEGSCHCGSVRFRVESETPYPYQACYCSICRKTAGGGGYVINLGADANTLEVEGAENVSVYTARAQDRGESERNFCRLYGSFLWLFRPGPRGYDRGWAGLRGAQLEAGQDRRPGPQAVAKETG